MKDIYTIVEFKPPVQKTKELNPTSYIYMTFAVCKKCGSPAFDKQAHYDWHYPWKKWGREIYKSFVVFFRAFKDIFV